VTAFSSDEEEFGVVFGDSGCYSEMRQYFRQARRRLSSPGNFLRTLSQVTAIINMMHALLMMKYCLSAILASQDNEMYSKYAEKVNSVGADGNNTTVVVQATSKPTDLYNDEEEVKLLLLYIY
jgi:hypothetical protein